MSPKKLKKTGSKKKDSKKDAGEKLSELEKEVFQIQIKNLNEKLQRLKTKYQELDLTCQSYKIKIEEVVEDKTEIVAYLRTTLDQKSDDIAELQERLNGIQKVKEEERKAHDQQVHILKTKHQEMKDQLTSENIVLGGRLASLEEFKAQKEETFARLKALQKQIKQQETDHHQALRNMEKKYIMEKDDLKKEMNKNLQHIAAEFRQISNKQMPDTTRRAIQENAVLTKQASRLKSQLESATEANLNLAETVDKQKFQIKSLEGMEKDWTLRNQSLLKKNESLVKELDLQISNIKDLRATKSEYEDLIQQSKQRDAENENLQFEIQRTSNLNEKLKIEIEKLSAQLDISEKFKTQFKELLLRVNISLQSGLNFKEMEESATKQQKDKILQDILDLLNKVNEQDMNDSDNSSKCYLSGDIGLIPRQKSSKQTSQKLKLSADKSVQTDEIIYITKTAKNVRVERAVKSAAYGLLHEIKCSANVLSSDQPVNVLMRF